MRKPTLAAIGALAAAVVVACGGGASTAPGASAPGVSPAPEASLTAGTSPRVPASRAPNATRLFYAITPAADRVYVTELQDGFRAAIEELGGDAATADAGLDPRRGLDSVREAIAAGAAGIAIAVPDRSIGPAVAAAARDAGVALVAIDVPIADADGAAVPLVGFDDREAGGMAGRAVARLLAEYRWNPKKVGVLSAEVQTLPACNERTTGARAEIRTAGVRDGQVFAVVYGGETSSAETAAAPVIAAHPDIERWVVIGCDDEGVLGVLDALRTFGVSTEDVVAVGLGAYLACVPWAARQPTGFKAAVLLSGRAVGRAAARSLYDRVVNGTALPAQVAVPAEVVTPSDLATVQRSYSCR